MDLPKYKERALSHASYIDMKRIRNLESSPEIRPLETGENPPPISLSPSAAENSIKMSDLLLEREQDQHLISLLKRHCFDQSKEIEKLKEKLGNLQKDYELLLEKSKGEDRTYQSLIQTAILARTRSLSLNAL